MSDQTDGKRSHSQSTERSDQADLALPGTSSEDDEIVPGGGSSLNFFVSLLDEFESSAVSFPAVAMSSTSSSPCRTKVTGEYEFSVKYNVLTSQRRNIGYSELLNKLFLSMDVWVEVKFQVTNPQCRPLLVRVLPTYVSACDLTSPVLRCPHHSQTNDPSNINFEFVHHLIRSHIFDVDFMIKSPLSATNIQVTEQT